MSRESAWFICSAIEQHVLSRRRRYDLSPVERFGEGGLFGQIKTILNSLPLDDLEDVVEFIRSKGKEA